MEFPWSRQSFPRQAGEAIRRQRTHDETFVREGLGVFAVGR
jgi:hypothetical protein